MKIKTQRFYLKITFGIILFFTMFNSCTTKTDLTNLRDVSYSSDISNIIASKCGSSNCHGSNAEQNSLIGYNNLKSYGGITDGDAKQSKLYKLITGRGIDGMTNKMPPKGNTGLSDQEISLIYVWIEQGAKNN